MIRIKNTLNLGRLPSEYQEVEYLQSTGSQHIDTTICPTTDFYCKMVASFANESDYVLCGVYYYSGTKRFAFGSYNGNLLMNSISSATAVQIANDQDYHTFIIDNQTGTRKIDDKSATSSVTDCIKPFYFFKRNSWYGSNDQQIDCGGNIKLKSCEMINNGVHYNFVPCYRKSDNVPGMYDLVNNAFYTNAGSGTFLMGNEVGKRDLNIKPMIGDKPIIREYVGDKLVYGEPPSNYEQLVNYTMLYDCDLGDAELNECRDITGGWSNNYTQATTTISRNDTYLELTAKTTSSATAGKNAITNTNLISFADYTAVLFHSYFNLGTTQTGNYTAFARYAVNDTLPSYSFLESTTKYNVKVYTPANAAQTRTGIDILGIKNVSGASLTSGYVQCNTQSNIYKTGNSGSTLRIYHICILKQDNWQQLCTIAGLNSSNYADETALCANSTAIATILNNQKAVEFMIYQCTGSFMVSAIQSETFLTALNNSSYKTIIYANEHWSKFLLMVGYSFVEDEPVEIEFVESIAPTDWSGQTSSNEYGEWFVTSTGHYSTNQEYYAFDSSDTSYWQSASLSSSDEEAYIQLDCPVLIKPSGARVTCKNLSNGKIQGYNPLTESWETLSTETFDTGSTQTRNELTVDTDTYYSKFRVSCNRVSSMYNKVSIYDFKIMAGTYKM